MFKLQQRQSLKCVCLGVSVHACVCVPSYVLVCVGVFLSVCLPPGNLGDTKTLSQMSLQTLECLILDTLILSLSF